MLKKITLAVVGALSISTDAFVPPAATSFASGAVTAKVSHSLTFNTAVSPFIRQKCEEKHSNTHGALQSRPSCCSFVFVGVFHGWSKG